MQIVQHGDITVVRFDEDLLLPNAEGIRKELDELIEQGHRKIILSLGGTQFVGAAGLHVIADSLEKARQRRGDMRLVVDQKDLVRIFELNGFDVVMEIYTTEREAECSFQANLNRLEKQMLWH